MSYSQEREVAVAAVTNACRLGEAVRNELVPTNTVVKADKSPVTVADFGIQCQVSLALRAAFPEALLIAEEEGEDLLLTLAEGSRFHMGQSMSPPYVMSRLRIVHIAAPTRSTNATAISPPAIGQVSVSSGGWQPAVAEKSQPL